MTENKSDSCTQDKSEALKAWMDFIEVKNKFKIPGESSKTTFYAGFEAGQKSRDDVKAYMEGKFKGVKLGERNERERILKDLDNYPESMLSIAKAKKIIKGDKA